MPTTKNEPCDLDHAALVEELRQKRLGVTDCPGCGAALHPAQSSDVLTPLTRTQCTHSYRTSAVRLSLLLLLWMLVVCAACSLIWTLDPDRVAPTSQPRRTRAPLDTRP